MKGTKNLKGKKEIRIYRRGLPNSSVVLTVSKTFTCARTSVGNAASSSCAQSHNLALSESVAGKCVVVELSR